MKGGPEKAMFFQSFPRTEEEEEEDEALKQEDEEKSVSGDPFVVVKLEDERDGGQEADRSAASALEISLFAPLESSEDGEGEGETPRPLTHADTACWPCAPDQDEALVPPQRRPRGRRKRPRRPKNKRPGRPRNPASVPRAKATEESEDTDENPDHPPPKKCSKSRPGDFPSHRTARSRVWEHFEYFINPDGELEDYGFPTCKLCRLKVACKRGNTSNMLRHLQENHIYAYQQTKKGDALWVNMNSSDSDMVVDSEEQDPMFSWCDVEKQSEEEENDSDVEFSAPRVSAAPKQRRRVRSAVWRYFHHNEGKRPSCKICGWRLSSASLGSTSNMRHHLQSQHQIVCSLNKFDSLVLSLPEGVEPVKLYPPTTPRKSAVWKLFGFVKNCDGVLQENAFPICRLCHQVVASKEGNTTNMYSHLQHHHESVYAELKRKMIPEGAEQTQDVQHTSDLHPPAKRRNSPVWKYFGFMRNSEGDLKEDGFPLCKMCHRKVAAKDGTTSNMMNHLRRHHPAEHEVVKMENDLLPSSHSDEGSDLPDLFPPSVLPLSPVWDYFGYSKNADGSIQDSERPKCKTCRQSIVSKQGILSNMLRHLKFYHDALFQELKSRTGWRRYRSKKNRSRALPIQANPDELFPPKMTLRSGVWRHFGYLKNTKGLVVPDGFPICKLCLRKVSTPKGCTTNMMVHLQRYHPANFTQIKLSKDNNDERSRDNNNDDDDIHTGENNGDQTGDSDSQLDLWPPGNVLEPVWEHFGFPKDADGAVQVDGHATCKLCRVKVSSPGQSTKYLYKHLWKKHSSVYFDIKVATSSVRQEDGQVTLALFPPTHRIKSAVWEYFGYAKDAEGIVVCDGFPTCKLCYLSVSAKGGNTTNMFKHLKDHHRSIYDGIRPSGPEEVHQDNTASSNLFAPDGENSRLWEYFGYVRNPDGSLEEDAAPSCKICGLKVTSEGEPTSNMMQHLQENHEGVYAEVQEALEHPSAEDADDLPELHPPTQSTYPVWQYFGFLKDAEGSVVFDGFPVCKICRQRVESKDGDTASMFHHLKSNHRKLYLQIKPAAEKKVYQAFELCPPNSQQVDHRLWDHFGYPKSAEGEVKDDGAPVCKICLQKLTASSKKAKLATRMLRHLRKNHQAVYEQVQEEIGAWRSEGNDEPLELHPPTQNVTSSVWDHFGYLKDAEGTVVCDGFPICKICHQKVASKSGNTTNMFKHLKDSHRGVYSHIQSAVSNEVFEDVRSAADLHVPPNPCDPTLWEHFGYRKNADGVVEEDGAPFCKLCLKKLVSRGDIVKNMKQHLKERHNTVYTEPEQEVLSCFVLELDTATADLHPPTRKVKSAVWRFFGYPRNSVGLVLSDGFPICKLCQKKVSAKGGNTTNMFTHLRDYHRATYNQIKSGFDPLRSDNKLDSEELHLPTTTTKDALSPVWKYFGYPKNAEGFLVNEGLPLCRLCRMKVIAKGGSTTNMLVHLRAYHLEVYEEVKPALAKKSIYKLVDLYRPSGQDNIKLWDHFGYQKGADEELKDDGAPICKICLRKLVKPPTGGTPTTNMLRHLRKKHQSVYNEVQEAITTLRTAWGIEPPDLHPPTQKVTSAVWQYFGYLKDAGGSVVCDNFPICKLCQQKVASKRRCTTNMFKHLRDYHRSVYDEIRCAVTSETFEDDFQPADLHPPSGPHNPKLWEHFGYRKTPDGDLEDDGAPICKLCLRKLISKGETTANMMQHLKENHNNVYTEVQREVNPFTIGGATELPELHPPEHKVRSGVWKHFGYLKDTEGPAECAGFPICKICHSKVSNKGKVTANMTSHLKEHHRSVYDELKMPDKKSKTVSDENRLELFPPSKQPPSPVWEHFGFPKNEAGVLEEHGNPFCRICEKKASSQDPRKMMRHLHFCHFSVYEKLKNAIKASKMGVDAIGRPAELHPPSQSVRSSVWEYFGYLKKPDGTVNVDGRPICKTCFQKVSSNGGNTTNMFKHLADKHGFSQ